MTTQVEEASRVKLEDSPLKLLLLAAGALGIFGGSGGWLQNQATGRFLRRVQFSHWKH